MIRVRDVYEAIDRAAPFCNALDFDNAGFLVGDGEQEVTRVLFALDITPVTLEKARAIHANLIVSHHPVIFSPLKALPASEMAYQLAQAGIAAICCHTNLDIAPDIGVNGMLGRQLGLTDIRGELPVNGGALLFSGRLPEQLSPAALGGYIKNKLGLSAVKVSRGSKTVERLFFCSGAGGDLLQDAADLGAAAYLTGEMKHHEELLAAALPEMTVIAAGHYETECGFWQPLRDRLQKEFSGLGLVHFQEETAPMAWET